MKYLGTTDHGDKKVNSIRDLVIAMGCIVGALLLALIMQIFGLFSAAQ